MGCGFLIAAPSSGSGKTTVTLGILRALTRRGVDVRGAKSGPDYIDPRFHEAACGAPCVNLDPWAMDPARLTSLASGDGLLVIEGAMGLFDGAPPEGKGACADLARLFELPVILVVDASRMAGSVAPLVAGFAGQDSHVKIAGVILNKVGSPRHTEMLSRALAPLNIPLIGALPRSTALTHPDRHLGLVQAGERPDLDSFLDAAAEAVEAALDLDLLQSLATALPTAAQTPRCPPPAQSIAVAQDEAFAFAYPHLLSDWRAQGAEIRFFSPLTDQAPPPVDLVYLPGGYPELHAGRLAANHTFLQGLREAAARRRVYGECGGYMVLGDGLIDKDGERHKMAGLLRLETSFAARKLHLGYRHAEALGGPFPGAWAAHEFHYATTIKTEGNPLFTARDAEGTDLGPQGLISGPVAGSFLHLIDRA
ncbi:cobyrinate a,c-diamide synthase [Celeribacter persicus]|uniref:Hydrogenobyrinate a,c-diamide synthase n=1 Tax=Celeribacter persicus TaxID=1651082 RepID=A0A2T5HU96_9RHOB|nr:cobyrinate a,c-diamide synthase [Celeribacter persicus]PTQ75169.1 cobyrinic acid a,c-diamide synthase [Celeribacter persicus]